MSGEHVVLSSLGAHPVRSCRRLPPGSDFQKEILETATGTPWQPQATWKKSPAQLKAKGKALPLAEATAEELEQAGTEGAEAEMVQVMMAQPADDDDDASSLYQPEYPASEPSSEATASAKSSSSDELMVDRPEPKLTGTATPVVLPTGAPPPPSARVVPEPMAGVEPEIGDANKRPRVGATGPSSSERYSHLPTTLAAQTAEDGKGETQSTAPATELEAMWQACLAWAEGELHEDCADRNKKRIGAIIDMMDSQMDPVKVMQARLEELEKPFDEFFTFGWMPKSEAHARGLKPRHYTWVDTKKLDVYKARFTCADVRKKGEEADGKTFSPTPQEASQKLLDLYALRYGYCTQSADIKSAFLIGKDPGTADGDPVVMRPPPLE